MQSSKSNDKLQRGFKTAIDHMNQICAFGTTNRKEDFEKTNGAALFHRYRYNKPGRYYKTSIRALTKEDMSVNRQYYAELNKVVFIDKIAQYNRQGNKIGYKNKQWYYHSNDYSNVRTVAINPIPLTKQDPLEDKQFNLTLSHKDLLRSNLLVKEIRVGNCGVRADLIAEYLWRHAKELGIFRIEIVEMTVDHVIVIVNRKEESNLNQPDQWGDAWVVDGWFKQGTFFPAKEFKEKIKIIKEYLKEQERAVYQIYNATIPSASFTCQDLESVLCEIKPSIHKYPAYSENNGYYLHEYYTISNAYPEQDYSAFLESKKQHNTRFKDCLSGILNAIFQLKKQHKTRFKDCLSGIPNAIFQLKKKQHKTRFNDCLSDIRKGIFKLKSPDKTNEKNKVKPIKSRSGVRTKCNALLIVIVIHIIYIYFPAKKI